MLGQIHILEAVPQSDGIRRGKLGSDEVLRAKPLEMGLEPLRQSPGEKGFFFFLTILPRKLQVKSVGRR